MSSLFSTVTDERTLVPGRTVADKPKNTDPGFNEMYQHRLVREVINP